MALNLMPGCPEKTYTVVYLGAQTEYWTGFHYDVKANYPDIYDKLTKRNFAAVPYKWAGSSTGVYSESGDCYDFVFYNPSTGQLSVDMQWYGITGKFGATVLFKIYMIY